MLGSPAGLDEPINRQPPAAPSVQVTSTEVLISTQQVAFSTAAALGAPRTGIVGRLVAIARGLLTTSTEASVGQRRHYPKRYGFLENALMAREMERL